MREFFSQLRRRKVFTVGAAYVVTAWLLLQVAATVFPIFDAPGWVLRVFTVLLALGFPLALVLAWAYDLTPRGVVRTALEDAAAPAPKRVDAEAEGLPGGPSIAVLPFSNLSGDASQDLFAAALTADIIHGLTRSSHLFVLADSAAANLEGAERDPAQAGRALGVSYLLQGSVQKAGSMLRVSAELVDVGHARRIWSQRYERELSAEDLFAVQDDIREQIVATLSDLHGVIYSAQTQVNVHRPTSSLNAYECLSVALAYDKVITPENHLRARESLERAIAIDPNYDEAWAHLSWIYTDEYAHGFNPLPEPMQRALAAARKGVELAPNNYHNHWLLSRVYYFMGERERFLAEVERALQLNSSDGTTLGLLGIYVGWAGDWDRGLDMLRKARLLNPNHPDYYYSFLGSAALVAGDLPAALEELQRVEMPGFLLHQAVLVTTLAELGRLDEARRTATRLHEGVLGLDLDTAADSLRRLMPFQAQMAERLVAGLEHAGLPRNKVEQPPA